jgi:hypothetical protein
MSEPSPLAKEITNVILHHLDLKDLMNLVVEQTTDVDKVTRELRRATYRKMIKGAKPIPISDMKIGQSYLVHIDDCHIKMDHSSYEIFYTCVKESDGYYHHILINKHTHNVKYGDCDVDPLSLYSCTNLVGYTYQKRNPSEYKIYPYKP